MNITSLLDFFQDYSLSTIIILILIIFILVSQGINVWDTIASPFEKWLIKRDKRRKEQEVVDQRLTCLEEEKIDMREDRLTMNTLIKDVSNKIDILTQSDKDGVKAYLTDKHSYYFYEKGWIDNYNLDCIERRYVHYKALGGNSFVDHLMEEMRELPTQPPEDHCGPKQQSHKQ